MLYKLMAYLAPLEDLEVHSLVLGIVLQLGLVAVKFSDEVSSQFIESSGGQIGEGFPCALYLQTGCLTVS